MAFSTVGWLWLQFLQAGAVQLRFDANANASTWTRIWHCEGSGSVNRQDYSNAIIREMATRASNIRICTAGSTTDCAQSFPGTFPIKMLASGWAISHNNGAQCNSACVAATWFGPRAATALWNSCGPSANNGQSYYWACNNQGGLHFFPWDNGLCSWQVGYGAQSNIEAFIDAAPPTPTVSCSSGGDPHTHSCSRALVIMFKALVSMAWRRRRQILAAPSR